MSGASQRHTVPQEVQAWIAARAQAQSGQALAEGAQALERLLATAERQDDTQGAFVALFLANVLVDGACGLSLAMLELGSRPLRRDMQRCLDVLRWSRVPLHSLVEGGRERALRVIRRRCPHALPPGLADEG